MADPMPQCPAKNRAGEPCGLSAGWGTAHKGYGLCKMHGGKSPGGMKQAAKQAAAVAVVTLGLPREIEPHAALLEELHRSAGAVAWLIEQVRALETQEAHVLVGGAGDSYARQEAHVWITMLATERKMLAAVAKTCIDVGVEERRVRLAETQARAWVAALRAILLELGVTIDERVAGVVRRHLAVVA